MGPDGGATNRTGRQHDEPDQEAEWRGGRLAGSLGEQATTAKKDPIAFPFYVLGSFV